MVAEGQYYHASVNEKSRSKFSLSEWGVLILVIHLLTPRAIMGNYNPEGLVITIATGGIDFAKNVFTALT